MDIIQFSESDELLDIRYDFVFKAVFTRNSEASKMALSDLISALIGKPVKVQTITANEPPVDDIRKRRIRFDIPCKAETGELVNIEMSLNPESCEPERFEYYEAELFTGQDIRGERKDYSHLKEAYQIVMLGNGLFYEDEALVHTFEYYDPANGVSFNGKTRIITVELTKAKQVIEKPTAEMAAHEAWAAFFHYLTDRGKRGKINEILKNEGGIAMAGEALIHISRDEIERARRTSEKKYILDTQSMRTKAWRKGLEEGREAGLQEGRQKGHQEGHQEGLQEGLQEGREEGIAEGHAEEKNEIARKMKVRGRPITEIVEDTGLTVEAIEKL
ncbi:MAG: Rpn family recombination-promoting nuclease/putative transposase [Treponema sp.]|jgi:predicted transposase/invertase (TIGR01784 family)|nr:Rpn family recombination-promoting nuclease/putative transposase [Treponema sp.]